MKPDTAGRNIVLTGIPRAGTTLSCNLLNRLPDTVALFEPMQVELLPLHNPAAAVDDIQRFFAESRQSLLAEGECWSQHIGGHVPDNPFSSHTDAIGQRKHEAVRGWVRVDKPLQPGFNLVIKHNGAFTALLGELAQRMEVYGIIRNPVAVLGSWHSVSLPVADGRLPAGERLAPGLHAALEAEADVLERQLIILDWFFGQFHRYLAHERISRYETLIGSDGASLAALLGLAMPRQELENRNSSKLYDATAAQRWADRLIARGGAWSHWYDDAAIAAAARALAERR